MDEAILEDTEAPQHVHGQPHKPISTTQIIAMCLAAIVEASHMTICFTIAVYMVYSFLKGADEATVGTLTGLLSSLYSMAQLVLAYMWGIISDRYGRKQLILMSNLFSTVSMLMFGLAGNYTVAAAARILGGAFNCSFTNVRCMLGESTDFSSQTVAMGYLGTAYGFGAILGPVIGGALAFPCEVFGQDFPLCGGGQLNADRPFFLPCLLAALISAVALVSNTFMLTETLPRIVQARAAGHAADQKDETAPLLAAEDGQSRSDCEGKAVNGEHAAGHPVDRHHAGGALQRRRSTMSSISSALSASDKTPWLQTGTSQLLTSEVSVKVADDIEELRQQGIMPRSSFLSPRASRVGNLLQRLATDASATSLEAADLDSDLLLFRGSLGLQSRCSARHHAPLPEHHRPVASVFSQEEHQSAGPESGHSHLDSIIEGNASGTALSMPSAKDEDDPVATVDAASEWYRDSKLILAIGGTTCIFFLTNILDEIMPIYAATPADHGGLQLSASELSLPLGVSGAALMMWSLLVFPSVVKRLGARACALLGLYVSVLVPVALGSVSFLAAAHVPRRGILAALVVVQIVKACFQQLCFPTAMAIQNRFCPPSKRGEVNGVSQSLASFVRAVGPFLGGLLWGVCSGLSGSLPGAQLLPFLLISAITGCTAVIYHFLPSISH